MNVDPRYHLITRLRLGVARKSAWDVFQEVEDWPRWWRWLDDVEMVREGDDDGVGAIFRPSISSPLRYGFSWQTQIVEVVECERVDLGSGGALEGRGRFEMAGPSEGPTDVVFTWLVVTTKRWMELLTPVARPAFIWSHNRLMTDFGRGLARSAGGPLLDVSHESVPPGSPGFYSMPGD